MACYNQLSLDERNRISILEQQGRSIRQIAFALGRSPSTISRELQRNIYPSQHSYRAVDAERIAKLKRKNRSYPSKVEYQKLRWIKAKLKMQWSPEQISARMKMELGFSISHEWIYQSILKDKQSGGDLYKNLRRSHRKNKKRYGSSHKSKYPAEKSIELRPNVVSMRARIGDWEGDTIVGPQAKSGVVTIVERSTNFARLAVTPKRHSNSVKHAIIELFKRTSGPKHTITFDRGLEFALYRKIESEANVDVYFAHAYCSYERGTNEQLNGLVRQYFPKKTDFTKVRVAEVKKVEWLLNNRPRKKLNYLTPQEAYFGYCPYPKYRDRPQDRDWKKQYELQKQQKLDELKRNLTQGVAPQG
jgi:IS30 family transposase